MATVRGVVTRRVWADSEKGRALLVIGYEGAGGRIEESKMWTSGSGSALQAGDGFVAEGEWQSRPDQRGKVEEQFSASRLRPELPVSRALTERFLRVNFNPPEHGLGAEQVTVLLQQHGDGLMRALLARPQMLVEASRRPDAAAAILAIWEARTSIRMAASAMSRAGWDEKMSEQVMATWGNQALQALRENPYRTARLPRIGFRNADMLGLSMGISVNDNRRLTEAVREVVHQLATEGSTCADLDILLRRTGSLPGIGPEVIPEFLRNVKSDDFMVIDLPDKQVVGAPELVAAEATASRKLFSMLRSGRRNSLPEVRRLSDEVMHDPKYARFDPVQRLAVMMASTEPVSIITGGPGVGKSTVMEAVVAMSEALDPGPVYLVAPFGKAAKRLGEACGREATTVHRRLGAIGGEKTRFRFDAATPLPAGCVVVLDESSTADAELFSALMAALPEDGRIVVVGDPEQLPSVGPGAVLSDLLTCGLVPTVALTEVYRSGRDSGIATGAALIRDGIVPSLGENDDAGVSFRAMDDARLVAAVEALVCDELVREGLDPVKDVAVLVPQAVGQAGTWAMNARLSRRLNPRGQAIPGIEKNDLDAPEMPMPRVGDRVMLTDNMRLKRRDEADICLMNGDLGTIAEACCTDKNVPGFKVRFDDGVEHVFPATQWRRLILAFAGTIHKYQGSQAKVVVMPIAEGHGRMLDRSMIYTGWTRAQKRCVLLGDWDTFERGIATVRSHDRRTLMASLMRALSARFPTRDGDRTTLWQRLLTAARAELLMLRPPKAAAVSPSIASTPAAGDGRMSPQPTPAAPPKAAPLRSGFGGMGNFGARRPPAAEQPVAEVAQNARPLVPTFGGFSAFRR